jgi:diguanylate cyclase (GGDEF)-like protein
MQSVGPAPLLQSTSEYLFACGAMLGLLVTALAALIHCKVQWLHRWLRMGWLSDLAFSKDPRQKVLLTRFMVGSVNCMVALASLNYGVARGAIDAADCRSLTVAGGAAIALGYAIFRSGLNKRFSDSSLSEPIFFSVIAMLAWGYQIGGPGRPVALLVLFIMLLFHMFIGSSRQLIRGSVVAAVSFGASMYSVAQHPTDQYTVDMQMVYFGLMATMLISVCLLVTELAALRAKSTQRKMDLSKALKLVEQLAARDELTGLFNRRHMTELLQVEKQRADRSNRGFAIGVIDVDHFKSVNDRFGHNVGDEVLASLSAALNAGLRDTDVVARWGGEEFLVMFTDTDDQAPMLVLDRIRNHLVTAQVSHTRPDLRISFSAGLTAYQFGESLNGTIERADQALYLAKAHGRNRTERAATPSAELA